MASYGVPWRLPGEDHEARELSGSTVEATRPTTTPTSGEARRARRRRNHERVPNIDKNGRGGGDITGNGFRCRRTP